MGAVSEGLVAMADAFRDAPAGEVAALIREVIADLIPAASRPTGT